MRSVALIVCFLSLVLVARFAFFSQKTVEHTVGQEMTITDIIWDEPKHGQFSQRFKLDGMTISVPEYPKYQFGDFLQVRGVVEENTFTTKQGVTVTEQLLKNPEITRMDQPMYLRIITRMLDKIIVGINRALPARESALLLGVTIGVRSEFDREMLDAFIVTGILHVVAASGSNVAILAGVVMYSTGLLVRRRFAILITTVIMAWYTVLSGFDPPIIRASVMALIALTAQAIGRQNYSLLALFLTLWSMLMVSPGLITDVSFQLSASASAGIILIKPVLEMTLKIPRLIREDLSTTLAAQLASLPIMLGVFGSFSPLSVLVNLFVLWTVPIIMIFGLLASFGALLNPLLALPFSYAAYPFLVYFLSIVEFSETFMIPFSVGETSIFLTISYYLLTLSFIGWFKLKHNEKS